MIRHFPYTSHMESLMHLMALIFYDQSKLVNAEYGAANIDQFVAMKWL